MLDVDEILKHKDYNPHNPIEKDQNKEDIALLKVRDHIDLMVYTPICLPPLHFPNPGKI